MLAATDARNALLRRGASRSARDDDVVGPSRLQAMSRKWLHVQCCSLAFVGFSIDTRTRSATTRYYSLHLGRSVLLNDRPLFSGCEADASLPSCIPSSAALILCAAVDALAVHPTPMSYASSFPPYCPIIWLSTDRAPRHGHHDTRPHGLNERDSAMDRFSPAMQSLASLSSAHWAQTYPDTLQLSSRLPLRSSRSGNCQRW